MGAHPFIYSNGFNYIINHALLGTSIYVLFLQKTVHVPWGSYGPGMVEMMGGEAGLD